MSAATVTSNQFKGAIHHERQKQPQQQIGKA
jgi:hypothetical protein